MFGDVEEGAFEFLKILKMGRRWYFRINILYEWRCFLNKWSW